jgi:hypothetical protein
MSRFMKTLRCGSSRTISVSVRCPRWPARAPGRPRRRRRPGRAHDGRVAPARHGRPWPRRPHWRLRWRRPEPTVHAGSARRGRRPAPHSQPADGPRRHEPAGRSRQLVDDHVAFATTSERNGLEYDALSLAVDLVLSVDRVQGAGHYQLDGARLGPKPVHEIGIWLGAAKPRALALTGRVADGWAAPLMSYMPPAAAAEAQTVIDRAARRCR